MENIILDEVPVLRNPYMVGAFRGWPDAAEGASGAVRYLIRKLKAKRFAEIDPEEFFDFTEVRPMTSMRTKYDRELKWPSNRFYYWKNLYGERDLIFFLGIEPNFRWRTFSANVMDLAKRFNVEMLVLLGALMDNVPHTREPRLSGSGNRREPVTKLESMGIHSSNYQGPTGIHSALYEACQKNKLATVSIWGHSPHYVQGVTNPRVSLALLNKLKQFLNIDWDLEDLKLAAASFDEEISKILVTQPEIQSYVQHLEEQYEEGVTDIASPEVLMKDLEDFLRDQRKDQGNQN